MRFSLQVSESLRLRPAYVQMPRYRNRCLLLHLLIDWFLIETNLVVDIYFNTTQNKKSIECQSPTPGYKRRPSKRWKWMFFSKHRYEYLGYPSFFDAAPSSPGTPAALDRSILRVWNSTSTLHKKFINVCFMVVCAKLRYLSTSLCSFLHSF